MLVALFEGDETVVPQSEVDSKIGFILHSWWSTQAIWRIIGHLLNRIIMIHEPIICIHGSERIISNS